MYGPTTSMNVMLDSVIRDTVHSVGRELSMLVLHESMKVVVVPLQKYERNQIIVKIRYLV